MTIPIKFDLPGEYGVSTSLNVADLSPFIADSDSRMNSPKEGGNDAKTDRLPLNEIASRFSNIESSIGPVTRSRVKKLKELLQTYIQWHMNESLFFYGKSREESLTLEQQPKFVTLIGPNNFD